MSERRFGVEIECGHSRRMEHVASILRNSEHKAWARGIGVDGSGVEIHSPVLKGPDGFEELAAVLKFLKKEGAFVSRADGMHVHHEAKDYYADPAKVLQLMKSWKANQKLIDSFVHPYRRVATPGNQYHPYNHALTDRDIATCSLAVAAGRIPHQGRRASVLNTHPLRRAQRTIEIRQFGGTLDHKAAERWIKFCQAFLDSIYTRKRAIASCGDAVTLLRRAQVPEDAASELLKRRLRNPGERRYFF